MYVGTVNRILKVGMQVYKAGKLHGAHLSYKNSSLVHVAPACIGSEKGSDHFNENNGTATHSLPFQIALQTTDLALLYKLNHQQHKGGSPNMPNIYCHLHTINWKYIKKDFNDYSIMST
jgi:hypothetical protein